MTTSSVISASILTFKMARKSDLLYSIQPKSACESRYIGEQERRRTLTDVGDLVAAYFSTLKMPRLYIQYKDNTPVSLFTEQLAMPQE
jgi:hypothetical protein